MSDYISAEKFKTLKENDQVIINFKIKGRHYKNELVTIKTIKNDDPNQFQNIGFQPKFGKKGGTEGLWWIGRQHIKEIIKGTITFGF